MTGTTLEAGEGEPAATGVGQAGIPGMTTVGLAVCAVAEGGTSGVTTGAAMVGSLDGALLAVAIEGTVTGLADNAGELGATELGIELPQAAMSRPVAASHARRGRGTAAL